MHFWNYVKNSCIQILNSKFISDFHFQPWKLETNCSCQLQKILYPGVSIGKK